MTEWDECDCDELDEPSAETLCKAWGHIPPPSLYVHHGTIYDAHRREASYITIHAPVSFTWTSGGITNVQQGKQWSEKAYEDIPRHTDSARLTASCTRCDHKLFSRDVPIPDDLNARDMRPRFKESWAIGTAYYAFWTPPQDVIDKAEKEYQRSLRRKHIDPLSALEAAS